MKKNDKFSMLHGLDVAQLLAELELSPLPLRERLGLPEDATFGLEVEFEEAIYKNVEEELLNIAWDWSMQQEPTVEKVNQGHGNTGGELVSPVLKDNMNSYRKLSTICDMLKKHNAVMGRNAGGHIHVGSHIMGGDHKALVNFIKVWVAFEKIIYRFAYGDKVSGRDKVSQFAANLGKRTFGKWDEINNAEDWWSLLSVLNPPISSISKRNNGVNFNNFSGGNRYKKGDTIEFRCPNGTLNPVVWQNNVNLFVKLMKRCKDGNIDIEKVDAKLSKIKSDIDFFPKANIVDVPEALEFADMVFDKNDDKAYFLKQYTKFFNTAELCEANKAYCV